MNPTNTPAEPAVSNNTALSRFEVTVDGYTAVLEYILDGKTLIIPHTEVPEAIGGRGIASQLARAVLGYAREQGLHVVPACEFIEGYLAKHPEYQDLLQDKAE